MPSRRLRPAAVLLAATVLLVAGAVRMAGLGSRDFIFDEWYTTSVITGDTDPAGVVSAIAERDAHPPLYYLLTWGWVRLVGFGDAVEYRSGIEWVLRLPSVLLGLGAIAALMAIGYRRFRPSVGLLAGAVAALSTVLILRDTEARMYPLFVLLSLVGYLLLERAVRTNRVASWLLYAASAAALLYTQYLAVFVLLGHAVFALHHLRRTGAKALLALTAAAAFLPWLPVLLASVTGGRANIDIREPLSLVASNAYAWLLIPDDPSLAARAVTAVAWALVGWGLLLTLRSSEQRAFVLGTLIVPFVAWWLVSLLLINVSGSRYLVIFLPWLLLLLAYGTVDVARRAGQLGAAVPLVIVAASAVGVWQFLAEPPPGIGWKVLRARGLVSVTADDAIISNSLIQTTLADYYLTDRSAGSPPLIVVDDPRELPTVALADRGTIWFIKTVFGPWDPRNWDEEEEAFFVRWSNDSTTLENVYLVADNTAIAELRPIGAEGSTP